MSAWIQRHKSRQFTTKFQALRHWKLLRLRARVQTVQKLLYRSKQRGLLELDLLVGEYAEKHLPDMNTEQLRAAEEILTEENPDLWKWITLQAEAPPHMQQNAVFQVRSASGIAATRASPDNSCRQRRARKTRWHKVASSLCRRFKRSARASQAQTTTAIDLGNLCAGHAAACRSAAGAAVTA